MTSKIDHKGRTIQILKLIALGVLLIGIGAVPSPSAISRILRELCLTDTRESRRFASRKVREFNKRGYIEKHGDTYGISDRGQYLLRENELWNLTIPKPPTWNRRWHFAMFDIPVKHAYSRQKFRACLHSLGLHTYQHSVLIHPYPIKNIVQKVAEFYRVSRYVSFVVAEQIDQEQVFKKRFRL